MAVPGMDQGPEAALTDVLDSDTDEKLREELKAGVQADARDIGTLRKELTVTVPAAVVERYLEENFKEIREDVVLPGFRKGRAPRELIQRRFGTDIRNQIKTTIVGQSFLAATEKSGIDVLGDPLLKVEADGAAKLLNLHEAMPHVTLPEQGDFVYVCEVELRPTFELPKLTEIPVRLPIVQIGDDDVEAYIVRQRKIRGRYEPLSGQPASESDDLIIADVTLEVDGQTIKSEDNVQLGVRPTRLDGIPLLELEKTLKGAKPGDELQSDCVIPDDYERPDLRGKSGRFRFKVHEVKRLAPISEQAMLELTGAADAAELRQQVREALEAERDRLVLRAQKEQVLDYLLANTKLDLPEDLTARQTDRAVMRRVIELSRNGVPDDEIEARIDELRTSARDEVSRSLRLEFILEKVAQTLDISVTDEEVNGAIAQIARQYERRFDRVRDDLHRRGLLLALVEQIRQDKCVEELLRDATIREVSAGDEPGK